MDFTMYDVLNCWGSFKFEKLHWLPIESRVIFKILLLVFKCIYGICSDNLVSKLKLKKYNCRSEYYLQLETRKASTKHGRRTFEYAGPRLWNTLPLNIRSEKEAESFKRKVKSLLFTDTEGFKRKAFQYEWLNLKKALLYRGVLGHRVVALYKRHYYYYYYYYYTGLSFH